MAVRAGGPASGDPTAPEGHAVPAAPMARALTVPAVRLAVQATRARAVLAAPMAGLAAVPAGVVTAAPAAVPEVRAGDLVVPAAPAGVVTVVPAGVPAIRVAGLVVAAPAEVVMAGPADGLAAE